MLPVETKRWGALLQTESDSGGGGLSRSSLTTPKSDSPVLAKTSFHLIIQWAASFKVRLANADCKSAFLQGEPDDERPVCIYMKPPNDQISKQAIPEWQDSRLLYRLTAPVYGQANAPRRWFLHVLKALTNLNWRQHTLDPCLFIQDDGSRVTALLGVHADDIVTCCLKVSFGAGREAFVWGSE